MPGLLYSVSLISWQAIVNPHLHWRFLDTHFHLLHKVNEVLVAQSCPTLCDPMDCSPAGSSVLGIFPGKNIGVGSHFLLQGIFPTQGSNPGLLHCRQILHCLIYEGSPAFIPRNKHLLISWLQSPSAVILETKKTKSVTVFSLSSFTLI